MPFSFILTQLHHNYQQHIDITIFMGAIKMSMGTTK